MANIICITALFYLIGLSSEARTGTNTKTAKTRLFSNTRNSIERFPSPYRQSSHNANQLYTTSHFIQLADADASRNASSAQHPLLSDPNFDPTLLTDDAARVIQSSRCTAEERQNRIQCFDLLPLDQYAVPLGSTVNMQCVVLNQHGKVQWRAKKILLGYDRSIPGYPRYRIIGDVSRGEHTLQIMDVQLDDAGEYECQVTPVPANNHPLLRRKTNLLVLVKPTLPRILYPDIPPPDNQLIIPQPDPIARITVLCVSTGGSPAPVFTWILNNREIPSSFVQSSQTPKKSENVYWSKLSPVIHSTPNPDESRLKLIKAGLKDGDQLTCSVTNEATRTHHDPLQHNLTTMVTIRIHTPPGPPRILSPKNNHDYLEGEELRAVCTASPPGNPFGGLFWRWLIQPAQIEDTPPGHVIGLGGHGGARFSDYSSVHNYFQAPSSGLDNSKQTAGFIAEDVQPLHYTLKKEQDQLVNTLVIPKITRRYHAAKLVCETGHPVGNAQHTSVTIYVRYPPANVTIEVEGDRTSEQLESRSREQVVYGKAGETKTLICRTSPYFRQANIKWIWQSADTSFDRTPRQLVGQSKSMRTPDGESWYQESRVDVKFTERDDRSYVDCRVWGEGDTRVDERVRLDIIYPPEKPVITGYENMKPVKMAHALELKCISSGGNPPPNLTWYRDKSPLTSQEDVVVMGRQSSLRIRIVPQKHDNGAHYHCVATNAATDLNGIASEPIILNVLFPPQRVSVSFHGQSVVAEGQPLVIDCQADTSNPVAKISWWHYRCGPAHAFEEVEERVGPLDTSVTTDGSKCKSVQLEGTDEKPSKGAAGGLHAHSRLWLRPDWKYHMDYVECRTENLEYGPPVWHDRLQLNVTFPPKFLGIQNRKSFVIREGQTLNLDLGPYSNPPLSSVAWFMDGIQIRSLSPLNATAPSVYVTGQHGELLALQRVTRKQMDNYTVIATNDLGQTTEIFFLNVTFGPDILGSNEENITDFASDRALLHCEATANPAIASQIFTWYRYIPPPGWPQDVNEAAVVLSPGIHCNQSNGVSNRAEKLSIECQQMTDVRARSTLIIHEVTRDDVGTYVCEVNNGLSEPIRKRVHLIYPFVPTIIHLPRYTKAAGEQGSVVTLTCLIRTEPTPRVAWLKNRELLHLVHSNDVTRTTQENKYQQQFQRIRPGLYKATLTLNDLRKSDFGVYHCQAVNIKGEAMLEIQLSGTSTPDVPLNLRLLNATTTTLHVAWTQGFDGGLTQTFQVRWKQATSPSMFKYADVAANDNHHAVDYLITGLESGTEYLVSVNSMNVKHGSSAHTDFITVRTKPFDKYSDSQLVPPLSSAGPSDDNAILVIAAACVFGIVILIINLVVISFLIKRRRQRMALLRQNKFRESSPFSTTMINGYTMDPTDRRLDRYGLQDNKYLADGANECLMKTYDADQDNGCLCLPQTRSRANTDGYIKADSFGTFSRVNNHPAVNNNAGAEPVDMGRYSAQHPHKNFDTPLTSMPLEYYQNAARPLSPMYNLSQSYHGSNALNDCGMVLPNSVASETFQMHRFGEPNQSRFTNFVSSREHANSFEPVKRVVHQTGKPYTPMQATVHPRYNGSHPGSPISVNVRMSQGSSEVQTSDVTELRKVFATDSEQDKIEFSHRIHPTVGVNNLNELVPNSGPLDILSTGLAAFSRLPFGTIGNKLDYSEILTSNIASEQQQISLHVNEYRNQAFACSQSGVPLYGFSNGLHDDIAYTFASDAAPLLLSLDGTATFGLSAQNGLFIANPLIHELTSNQSGINTDIAPSVIFHSTFDKTQRML